jgi:anti-sigma B factor antagonist
LHTVGNAFALRPVFRREGNNPLASYPAHSYDIAYTAGFGFLIAGNRVAGYNRQTTRPPPRAATSGDSQNHPNSPLTPLHSVLSRSGGVALGLQLIVRRAADVVIVDLTGIATMGPANDFLDNKLRQLIDGGTNKILVNLTDVTQLDSSGIGTIVRAFISLKHRGASLKLLRPRGNVRLVLQTVHLLDVIPSIEDEAQGIASFR